MLVLNIMVVAYVRKNKERNVEEATSITHTNELGRGHFGY